MSQKGLSRFARFILLLFALPCAAFYFFGVPVGGYLLLEQAQEAYVCYLLWIIFIGLMAFPVCISFAGAWKSLAADGKTPQNSRRVRRTAWSAVLTTVYFFVGNAVLFFTGMFQPSVFPVGVPLAFIGVAVTVLAAVFSYVSFHAEDIREDF